MRRHHRLRMLSLALLGGLAAAQLGCEIIAFPFFIAKEIDKQGSHIEPAQYTGLEGRSVAVLVSADRSVQANFPGVVPEISVSLAERIREHVDITGYVPGRVMLAFQYENPSWSALAYGELAEKLGVERLVVVDLREFRLNDPGNRYLYDGVADAAIGVVEADGPYPDDIAYELFVNVTFPDAGGFGPEDFTSQQVMSVLMKRFLDRASWPFYDAEVPNDINY
ncbi:MAG: hypothetical protein ACTS22_04815 [Phycisphaerales bacterium]